jgi:hypothetical protein
VTLPEEKGQFVTIAHQAGVTNRGVGYGVLLNGASAPQGQAPMSIDAMTAALIKRIQQSNELEQLGASTTHHRGGHRGALHVPAFTVALPRLEGSTQSNATGWSPCR